MREDEKISIPVYHGIPETITISSMKLDIQVTFIKTN